MVPNLVVNISSWFPVKTHRLMNWEGQRCNEEKKKIATNTDRLLDAHAAFKKLQNYDNLSEH